MSTVLQDGQTLLFIGDSITDCGRRDDRFRPLGTGYVRFFRDLLIVREPEKDITIENRGIGGHTVPDLRNRWFDDAISHQPDWLSIKIGINDLSRYLLGNAGDLPLDPKGYAQGYRWLLETTRRELPDTQLLLISPFFISRDPHEDTHRGKVLNLIPRYIETVGALAAEFGARYLDLHAVFAKHLEYRHPDAFCPEPVHPNETGHRIMAEAVYATLAA